MRTIIGLILLTLSSIGVIGLLVIPLGAGIGWLLAALFPRVDFGTGIIAGAVFSTGIILIMIFVFITLYLLHQEDEDDEDDEGKAEIDESYVMVPTRIFNRKRSAASPKTGRKKDKRRSRR